MTGHIALDIAEYRGGIDGRAERSLMTAAGYLLVYGWLSDQGHGHLNISLTSAEGRLNVSPLVVLRSRRSDVEDACGFRGFDFGYLLFACLQTKPVPAFLTLSFSDGSRQCELEVSPQLIANDRLLEDILAHLGSFQSNRGRMVSLQHFLVDGGRTLLAALYCAHVREAAVVQSCVAFGAARRGPTFQTVLYGAMDAALFQPLLFAQAGIRFGEWNYVCNSPQDAQELLRFAHLMSKLYDLPLKVTVLSGNAGFGAANNVGMSFASTNVVLVNPDVHVMGAFASMANEALEPVSFGPALRGALLFYDDDVLMHGGMYLTEDLYFASGVAEKASVPFPLLRVEHHDKGVPFDAKDWSNPRPVPAITGAFMAFRRENFEALDGFSQDYLFGHYEDADLCLRWAGKGADVSLDPRFRLVHLEGQGSKTRLPHFHGASIVNRFIFDNRVRILPATRAAIHRDIQTVLT